MKVEEAPSLKTQTDLGDLQYQMLRISALSHDIKIYPSFDKIIGKTVPSATFVDLFTSKIKKRHLQTQFSQLKPFSVNLNIPGTVITIKVTFKIDMIMFNGKVINSLAEKN